MDKLHAMQMFVQIVEKGSLTGAAEAIGTSLPSVVRTLAALEQSLGIRLLNRTTRRIALTNEGRHYLERCQHILSAVSEAESALISQRQEPSGELRVTAPVLFGQLHVMPIVSRFVQRYPATRVNLLLLDRVTNLVEEGIDVAIRIGHLPDSSLVAMPVGHIRRVVCASPRYLKSNGTPRDPRDLENHNCLQLTGLGNSPAWTFYRKGRPYSIPVKGALTCNQAAATIDACADGLGISMFLSYQVAPLLAEKKLRLVLEDFEPPPIPVSIVYPHAKLLSSRVRVFTELAAETLRARLDSTSASP